ncbi:MAG: D-hexose-6-phosphate mutarotase, partial [Noviherbaspirillum sp.]
IKIEARNVIQKFSSANELHGFPGLSIANERGDRAFIARQGAQVLSWQTHDGKERLYLSALSGGMRRGDRDDAIAQPIRGGIPVCFPQFSGRGPLLKHGFARAFPWSGTADSAGVPATLKLRDQDHTRKIWPHAFDAETTVTLEPDRLVVALSVTNRDSTPWAFTAALHTYLRTDDIRNVQLQGLQNVRYEDATAANALSVQQEKDLRIGGELDRVYLSPPRELLLLENGAPSLRIAQQGFEDTVVWNPGPDNARALADFPDEDWLRMLCVEAACVATPVLLQPGESWEGRQLLTVAGS